MAMTDLTGTKWYFNSSLNIPSNFDLNIFRIDLASNGVTYERIRFKVRGNASMYYAPSGASETSVYSGTWTNEAYRIIEITGGTDATNANLISWLQANATQIQDEPANTFSFGNLPIANMYFGTRQVKKIYLGNALVWEKEEETGYNVSITFSNCSGYSKPYLVFDAGTIDKETFRCNFSSSNQIGSLSSANGTINVSTTTGKIYIVAGGTGYVISPGTINYSNGITEDFEWSGFEGNRVFIDNQAYANGGYTMVTMVLECSVNADGTITIDGFDWDD